MLKYSRLCDWSDSDKWSGSDFYGDSDPQPLMCAPGFRQEEEYKGKEESQQDTEGQDGEVAEVRDKYRREYQWYLNI